METEHVVAMWNHRQMCPGHVLIVPKRHTVMYDDISEEEVNEMHKLLANSLWPALRDVYGAKGYVIVCQSGVEAGQTVPHVHWHILPRRDHSTWAKVSVWIYALVGKMLPWSRRLTPEQMENMTLRLLLHQ
jgi:diadenosine tetraphosphate (Ap4A) HIT family hydrolase